MTSESLTIQFPTTLYQLIEETFKIYEDRKVVDGCTALFIF